MSFVPEYSKVRRVRLAKKSRSKLSAPKSQCLSFFPLAPFAYSQTIRYKAGQKEVQILNRLKQSDPDDKKHVVRLERTFEHRGHLCLVFESLRSLRVFCCFNAALTFTAHTV